MNVGGFNNKFAEYTKIGGGSEENSFRSQNDIDQLISWAEQ